MVAVKAQPLVSVIIPTYNRESLLAEAIESVLSQTMREFELIVVDDGSSDGTEKVVRALVQRDGRVHLLHLNHTGYPGAVRNRGVAASRAEYLTFLDSDDLWEPQKLELQLQVHKNGGFQLTHTRELWLRNGKTVSQSGLTHRREGDIFADSLVKCIIGPSTVMLDRQFFDAFGGFREDLEIGEDYELWLRMTSSVEVGYLDVPLTRKRAGHGDQLTEKYGHIEYFRIEALRNLVEEGFFSEHDPDRVASARPELARKCRIYAIGARKRGREKEAQQYEELAAKL